MSRDLQRMDEVKAGVAQAYRAIEEASPLVAPRLYSDDELSVVPAAARDRALGVNNHLPAAGLRPGETVLDLGCGAGIDAIIAAHAVGPSGRVIALDFLPEMLERTAHAAAEVGLSNVEPLEGEMESIPLPDESVDVVVSNGVINLSARKQRVLAECFRVLRPGGRFCVSDLTIEEERLPTEILTHPAAWAG